MNGQDDRPVTGSRRFLTDTRGATAIEYGLIVALLSVALITTLATLSTNMNTIYNTIIGALK